MDQFGHIWFILGTKHFFFQKSKIVTFLDLIKANLTQTKRKAINSTANRSTSVAVLSLTKGPFKMTSPGGGGGVFAKLVTNGDKGGRGLLVGGDVTTEKKIDSYILVLPL